MSLFTRLFCVDISFSVYTIHFIIFVLFSYSNCSTADCNCDTATGISFPQFVDIVLMEQGDSFDVYEELMSGFSAMDIGNYIVVLLFLNSAYFLLFTFISIESCFIILSWAFYYPHPHLTRFFVKLTS